MPVSFAAISCAERKPTYHQSHRFYWYSNGALLDGISTVVHAAQNIAFAPCITIILHITIMGCAQRMEIDFPLLPGPGSPGPFRSPHSISNGRHTYERCCAASAMRTAVGPVVCQSRSVRLELLFAINFFCRLPDLLPAPTWLSMRLLRDRGGGGYIEFKYIYDFFCIVVLAIFHRLLIYARFPQWRSIIRDHFRPFLFGFVWFSRVSIPRVSGVFLSSHFTASTVAMCVLLLLLGWLNDTRIVSSGKVEECAGKLNEAEKPKIDRSWPKMCNLTNVSSSSPKCAPHCIQYTGWLCRIICSRNPLRTPSFNCAEQFRAVWSWPHFSNQVSSDGREKATMCQ